MVPAGDNREYAASACCFATDRRETDAVAPAAPSFEQYYGQNSGNQPQNEQFYNQNKGYIIYGRTDSADVFEEKASAPVGREGLDIII